MFGDCSRQQCLETVPDPNAAKIWVGFFPLVLISIARGTQKASECPVCTKELRARKGVHSSLKLRGRGDFLALETSGYSLTCFTSFSPGIHYSGKFWRFLLPSFLPFLLLLPKMMQGLLLTFFTAIFIWQKSLC